MRIGDKVIVPGSMIGVLVGDIERGDYSPEYKADEWAYLETGLLVETEEAGLIHFPDRRDVMPVEV